MAEQTCWDRVLVWIKFLGSELFVRTIYHKQLFSGDGDLLIVYGSLTQILYCYVIIHALFSNTIDYILKEKYLVVLQNCTICNKTLFAIFNKWFWEWNLRPRWLVNSCPFAMVTINVTTRRTRTPPGRKKAWKKSRI